MKIIDINHWERKEVFQFYKDMDFPMYSMTFELDVTHFYKHIKQEKKSFYFSFMHLLIHQMNQITNFKYRFLEDKPCLCDSIHPSFTDLIKGKDLFKIVTVDYCEDVDDFIDIAKRSSDEQGESFINLTHEVRQDLVYITTFPWASYKQVTFAHNQDAHDAIPRITWGKFENINGKMMMPFTVAVHHAFVDGLHVGKLISNLQNSLSNYTI